MDLMLTISLGNAFQLETGHYKETNKQTNKGKPVTRARTYLA